MCIRDCNSSRCVANIDGKCAVSVCKGEVGQLDAEFRDVQVAAQFYDSICVFVNSTKQ